MPALLGGWVLGTAWQVQQAALWPRAAYAGLAAAAIVTAVLALWAARDRPCRAVSGWLIAAACAAFAVAGMRAGAMQAQALDAALAGFGARPWQRAQTVPLLVAAFEAAGDDGPAGDDSGAVADS